MVHGSVFIMVAAAACFLLLTTRHATISSPGIQEDRIRLVQVIQGT